MRNRGQSFSQVHLCVSFKLLSLTFAHIETSATALLPSPQATPSSPYWQFGLDLIDILQQHVSGIRVSDVGPGEDGAAVQPKTYKNQKTWHQYFLHCLVNNILYICFYEDYSLTRPLKENIKQTNRIRIAIACVFTVASQWGRPLMISSLHFYPYIYVKL